MLNIKTGRYPIKIEEGEINAQYLISEFIVYSGISIDGD